MSSDGRVLIYSTLGFGAGVYWFFQGFRIYREFRVLEDTPEIPIRSVAMGLVHVHGKAQGDHLVNSPVTKTPCYFYKVDIERWVSSKNGGHWAHYKTDADGAPFYLEDASGRVLIDAHRAEYDLLQTAKRDTGGLLTRGLLGASLGSLFSGSSMPTIPDGSFVSNQDLLTYVESLAGGSSFSLGLGGISGGLSWGSGRRYRLTESCIMKDHWYDVTGTCAENPAAQDEHNRNMILKGENEPTFLISWRNEKGIESKLRQRALLHIFGGSALSLVSLGVLLADLGWLF